MDIKQVATHVNSALTETLGESAVLLTEDLSNVVDVGSAVFRANSLDRVVHALVDHIGKVVFVNRPYNGIAPKIYMDSWEFGAVLEKISGDMPAAQDNPSWNLQTGQVYEQDEYTAPTVNVKFYHDKTTFEVPISVTDYQMKSAFSSAEQLVGFVSWIFTQMENAMTKRVDILIMNTIVNMAGETVWDEYKDAQGTALTSLSAKSGVRAINLLYLYNQSTGSALTVAQALKDPDFLRFAGEIIRLTMVRLRAASKLFNVGGKDRFTPENLLKVVLLSDFVSATATYLQSGTFHKELVALPGYQEVPYWQGTGEDYSLNATFKINIASDHTKTVDLGSGKLLGVMFDRDALGVNNYDRRITDHRNAHGEFTNYWYKQDARFFNDLNENYVAFFIA